MKDLTNFCISAPNLKSFIGGSICALSPSGGTLTAEERSQRIKELEEHFGHPANPSSKQRNPAVYRRIPTLWNGSSF